MQIAWGVDISLLAAAAVVDRRTELYIARQPATALITGNLILIATAARDN